MRNCHRCVFGKWRCQPSRDLSPSPDSATDLTGILEKSSSMPIPHDEKRGEVFFFLVAFLAVFSSCISEIRLFLALCLTLLIINGLWSRLEPLSAVIIAINVRATAPKVLLNVLLPPNGKEKSLFSFFFFFSPSLKGMH